MIREATWKLPDGHRSVSVWNSQAEAEGWAREHLPEVRVSGLAYYLTDKRGVWEVISYNPNAASPASPLSPSQSR